VGSVVVLNTCLCVVLLSRVREGWGGEESHITAKGVALHVHGKGVPSPPHKRSPLSLKEESRWPPRDSILEFAGRAEQRRSTGRRLRDGHLPGKGPRPTSQVTTNPAMTDPVMKTLFFCRRVQTCVHKCTNCLLCNENIVRAIIVGPPFNARARWSVRVRIYSAASSKFRTRRDKPHKHRASD